EWQQCVKNSAGLALSCQNFKIQKQTVFLCPFVRDLIVSVVYEPCKPARWPHSKSRSPYSRRADRRLCDSTSQWRRGRRVAYQGETRRRREEGLGVCHRQVRS